MVSTGVTRPVDELGRIVIPKEIRNALGWTQGARLEIFAVDDGIVLKTYKRGCTFCGSMEQLVPMDDKGFKYICISCAQKAIASLDQL